MKIEDLKNAAIVKGTPGVNTTALSWNRRAGVHLWHGPNDVFDTPQTALLAAARFRASEEMYQALKGLIDATGDEFETAYGFLDQRNAAFAALALADNTNETLPL